MEVGKGSQLQVSTGRFLLRAGGLCLIVGAIAIYGLYGVEGWGWGVVPLVLWSILWALVLGVIGLRSMVKGLSAPGNQVLKTILAGLFVRLAVLAASQLLVFWYAGPDWGARALLATTVLYVVVLFVECHTLVRELTRMAQARREGAA